MGKLISAYRRSLQPDRQYLLNQYRVVEMARKVVGVGSVGTRAWIVLLQGVDDRTAGPAGQGSAGVGARAVPRASETPSGAAGRARGSD